MATIDRGGSISVSTTAVLIELQQNLHAYTILNKSADVVYLQFDGGDVSANTTDLGEGKFWLAQNEGIQLPSSVHSVAVKTAAGTSIVFLVREERGAE